MSRRIFFVHFAALLLMCAAIYIFIRSYTISQTSSALTLFANRVQQGLVYTNGKWDTTRYTADPQTPHPSGSGGFTTPLYVFTTYGFVIERTQPINGLFDSSDFDKLRSFQTPQTLSTITNEQWRVYSRTVGSGTATGVILVSYYKPPNSILPEIDTKLVTNAERIAAEIHTTNSTLDVSTIDISTIDYDVSFEIVDSLNKVLLNNGRTPSFIDKSYISQGLQQSGTRILKDRVTSEPFLVQTHAIVANGKTVGLIVVGSSIGNLMNLLKTFLLFSLPLCLGMSTLIYLVHSYIRRETPALPMPTTISFIKKESILMIDMQTIGIPYASNQYYIVMTLFSNPKKRWELDELLEKMGVEARAEHWRKVYDAVTVINRKTAEMLPEKLILLQDKTYQINPVFVSVIQ